MPTIKEIAELANVSIATVSRVINKSGFVHEDKIERVNQALKELDYRPNFVAKSLRSGKTHSIGLSVPDNSNPFFAELARSIEEIGYQKGYSIILCDSDYSAEKEQEYINILTSQKVDGFILVSSIFNRKSFPINNKTPFVSVGHDIRDTCGNKIIIDYQYGGYIATRHLIDLGHRRIACITGKDRNDIIYQRVQGYRKALKENDIIVDESLIVQGDFNVEGGIAAMKMLLKKSPLPSSVFVHNDFMAIGAIHAIHESGLKVPEDISVVGYDNIQLGSVLNPPITTVAHPLKLLAESIMDMLFRCMENTTGKNVEKIIPELIIRKSTSNYKILK